jgi:hypothetical protein
MLSIQKVFFNNHRHMSTRENLSVPTKKVPVIFQYSSVPVPTSILKYRNAVPPRVFPTNIHSVPVHKQAFNARIVNTLSTLRYHSHKGRKMLSSIHWYQLYIRHQCRPSKGTVITSIMTSCPFTGTVHTRAQKFCPSPMGTICKSSLHTCCPSNGTIFLRA